MTLSSDIARFNKKTGDSFGKVVRASFLMVVNGIIRKTPVGNASLWKSKYAPSGYVGGRLRANWQSSINMPKSGEVDSVNQNDSTNSALSAAEKFKVGNSLYAVNNLKYAQAVENGHSQKQAPAGMVRVSILGWDNIVSMNTRRYRV